MSQVIAVQIMRMGIGIQIKSIEDRITNVWFEGTVAKGNNYRDRAFTSLLEAGRISISEAVRLFVKDIDFERGVIRIGRIRVTVRRKCMTCGHVVGTKNLFCSGCGRRLDEVIIERSRQEIRRTVWIDSYTLRCLRDYLNWRKRFTYHGELVFPFSRQRGCQISKKVIRRVKSKGSVPRGSKTHAP